MYRFTNIPVPGATSGIQFPVPTARPSVSAAMTADDDGDDDSTAGITDYY